MNFNDIEKVIIIQDKKHDRNSSDTFEIKKDIEINVTQNNQEKVLKFLNEVYKHLYRKICK